jgi:hypothetical protein
MTESLSDKLLKARADENPTYFMCGKKSIPALVEKAKKEAAQLLKELELFYSFGGDVDIIIEPVHHELCYSIGATLTWNGKAIKSEDTCDLLFLELNELMLNRMLKSGMVSFGNVGKGEHK